MTIDPHLVDAVIAIESAGDPKAVSPAGAKGLMQIMDPTYEEWHRLTKDPEPLDPFNAEQNRRIGTAYLEYLIAAFSQDLELALAAYNWGIGNVKRLQRRRQSLHFAEIEADLPRETQSYVEKVTRNYKARCQAQA